jgi:arginyl-tRNA synthetase
VITQDVRRALARAVAAEGFAPADPGLRPGGAPGCYASSVAFRLATGRAPRDIAHLLAARLAEHPWLARTDVSGPGFIALTVTTQTLTALPERIRAAGPACARSEVLSGVSVAAPPAADPLATEGWEEARAALAAELTVRLSAAAGATVMSSGYPERMVAPAHRDQSAAWGEAGDRSDKEKEGDVTAPGGTDAAELATASGGQFSPDVAAAVWFAGPDAVRFSLARAVPGRPVRIDAGQIARHVLDNPAYAVRYAHARAASGVRWAATLAPEAVPPRLPADPGELALLDALSWLPERVAVAARRRRPDEYARYLEELASVTIATLSSASHPGSARAPGSDRLTVAGAAATGLAAGLELLGISAPDRL